MEVVTKKKKRKD
jgi:hypothetical protein